MSQELLYTSAPEGLNPSDQGFCTVACTQGMPRNLKEVLESLSGYRQAEQPPHPVNYSHLIHTIGGKRYQILSRVSDYEKDYSGRTNKLAHHVALTIDELPACGPAALLATSVFRSDWDGRTRWIQGGPILPAASAHQGPCLRWDTLAGDAGWAGILAESAADGSNRPMYVIFPQGEDVLPLVSEALGVLPPGKAWTTSFSTYFTKLPAGVDCVWRFVLDGSPEAHQARSAGHGRVIDLVDLQRTRRRAPAGNPYVEAARAGTPSRRSGSSETSVDIGGMIYTRILDLPNHIAEPDVYQLLGIAKFESDEATIRSAALDRNQLLQRKQNAQNFDDVKRIERELGDAFVLLMNPQSKAQYDRDLARSTDVPVTAPAMFAASGTSATMADGFAAPAESAPPESPFARSATAPASPFGPKAQKQTFSKLAMILAGAAVVLVAGVGTLVYSMLSKGDRSESRALADASPEGRSRKSPNTDDEQIVNPQEVALKKAAAMRAAKEKNKPLIVKTKDPEPLKASDPAVAEKVVVKGPWDRSLKRANGVLPLPERKPSAGLIREPEPTKLTELHTLEPAGVNLTLYSIRGNSNEIAQEGSEKEGFLFEIEDGETDEGQKFRRWIVKRKVIGDSDGVERRVPIGEFELFDQDFTFRWDLEAQDWASPNSLQYCLLEISQGKESHQVRLSKPKIVEPEPYRLAGKDQELYLAIKSSAVERPEALMLDLELLGAGEQDFSRKGLTLGKTATFPLKDQPLEFDLAFQYTDGRGPYLKVNPVWNRKILVSPLPQRDPNRPREELGATLLKQVRDAAEEIPIEDQRLNVNIPELKRVASAGEFQAKLLADSPRLDNIRRKQIPEKERQLGDLAEELRKARKNREPTQEIEDEIENVKAKKKELDDIVGEYDKRIKLLKSHVTSSAALQKLFEDLSKSLRVSYNIYLVIDGERIDLVRTQTEEKATNPPQTNQAKNQER